MPFSTQNLFVGHTLFKNVKIQCIDSPGVLDRPLDQRNTIEMQSLTALAHLKSLILFILDVSESCGNSLEE
jgi:nucleolar GTP-binding protein